MKIAVVGLGLIGGSLAKALKAHTLHKVGGYDRNPDVLAKAMAEGAVDDIIEDSFAGWDMVLISLYPADTIAFLEKFRDSFSPGTLIVDMCGVKTAVCRRGRELFAGTGVDFLGGHPMAGRECSGYDNAQPELFRGASMILTPEKDFPIQRLEDAESLFLSLGFGRMTLTTPQHHDEVIAYTSQLAHVVSSAYMQSPTAEEYMGFSAGSFGDLTRVAKLNEVMWSELFLANAGPLVEQIDNVQANLTRFRALIADGKREELQEQLRKGRLLKEKVEIEQNEQKGVGRSWNSSR